MNASYFHAANLLLHACAVVVLFRLFRLLVGKDWPAAAGAMLFALHPLQTEAVAWATGMKDVLSGLFAVTAVWLYVRAAAASADANPVGIAANHSLPQARRFLYKRVGFLYATATVAFALALLSKPSTVVVPGIVGVLDAVLLRRPWRRVAAWLLPWAALATACAVVAAMVQPPLDVHAVPLWARPSVAADALAFYLYKLAWPQWLGIDYGRTPDGVLAARWLGIPLPAVAWLPPAAVALAVARLRKPALTAAALVFVLGVLPVLGLRPFVYQRYSTVSDRYVYLSMLGPALAVAWLAARFPSRAVGVGLSALLAAFAVRSYFQAGHWRDSEAFYRRAIAVNPRSFLAHNDLGVILDGQGDVAGATAEFQTATDLKPDAQCDRYVADHKAAAGDPDAAVDYARRLVELQPHLPEKDRTAPAELHHWVGRFYVQSGDAAVARHDFASARRAYERAVDEFTRAGGAGNDLASARQRLASLH